MKLDPQAFAPLLESLGNGNPMVKQVAQLVLSSLGDKGDDGDELELARRRRRAARRLRRMRRLIDLQSRRNAFVASALGACECWGNVASCSECGGRGRPGFVEPAGAAFEAIVVSLLTSRPDLIRRHLEVSVTETPQGAPPMQGRTAAHE